MSDDESKSAIPAWQQTQKTMAGDKPGDGSADSNTDNAHGPAESIPEGLKEVRVEAASGVNDGEDAKDREQWDDMDKDRQLEHMRAFLDDPAVKDEPIEKKRTFFHSKGIPTELIDQVLGPTKNNEGTFTTAEFSSFRQEDVNSRSSVVNVAPQPQREAAPPIITYPEFLVEAHKPPPLITINRLVNTAYVAGALATLTYAANQYLLKPMVANLTEARHDFATHNQTKLDEFNERLMKVVSKVPQPRNIKPIDDTGDDAESIDSDPTELFHRDIGTQTSTPSSPSLSGSTFDSRKAPNKTVVDKHEERLRIMQSHLSELNDGFENDKKASETRKEKLDELRHSLDVMLYGSHAISLWSQNEDAGKKKEKVSDIAEELQKEIKGVKSSLLSARRFPAPAPRKYGGVSAT